MGKETVFDLSLPSVEKAFEEVSDAPRCGGIAQQIDAGALNNFPGLERALQLVNQENEKRKIPEEFSRAIQLGAQIIAVTMARTAASPEISVEE